MGVSIARKITRLLFTLLITVNANLATKISVSATSSIPVRSKQQSWNAPANQEIATTVDRRPVMHR